jgi:predicted HAD superfamily Cof-like phosphohydrolase
MFTGIMDKVKLFGDKVVGFKPDLYELNPGYGDHTLDIYGMVNQFHGLFQHPQRVAATPTLLRLRAKLIREEAVEEGIPAADNSNLEKVLDAMADFLYVGIGTMVAIRGGAPMGMSIYTQDQSVGRFHETLSVTSAAIDDVKQPFLEAGKVADELEALATKIESENLTEGALINELRRVLNMLYVACSMAYRLADLMGLNIVELVAEVHRSNMTKLWPGDDAERAKAVARCQYESEDLGFRGCEGTDLKIGFRISDGKILKSPTYSEADLVGFVEEAKKSTIVKEL